ncbi:uncharacterized protein LOC133303219 [Gastrolobium bilobum]|uniref:uncharacterized protein LOC133303219 n=1 Tax=Gastrolobium bilobum TaxID=150636 RepID=UPI002AB011BE|nr:uncharacterized protein LOC133303219 [Gastrolobium bilobum]
MKINPFAKKRNNNQRSQYGVVSSAPTSNTKKLWRLPHVFAQTLELPLPSDADVSYEETPQFLRFVASCNQINMFNASASGVRAHAIEILPGITKIVIKRMDGGDVTLACQQLHHRLGVDLWRFRLPSWAQPEMVTAVCSGGKLVVTVPKSREN